MRKILLVFFPAAVLLSCSNDVESIALQRRVDSLQLELQKTYRPGFGEFMSSVQVHHEKLWFAGINNNWALADFEINEIQEALDGINEYCKDRKESSSLPMISAPVDSLKQSIENKDVVRFKKSFVLLTNTCNNCHHETDHGFNVIKIPDSPPFSNQVFAPANK